MGKPVELQSNWSRGMKQDPPRVQMPQGSSWSMVDYVPNLGAPLRKRGGWSYASPDLAASAATGATYVRAVAYANFVAGAKLCAITDDAKLVTVASTASATLVGDAVASVQNPVFYGDKLIITAGDGTTAPKKYDGSSIGSLGGSPPAGKYASVYRDRVQLAGTSANPTFVYFSDVTDPEGWDTTNSYIAVSQPVTGLAALPGALMVFQATSTSRMRGSTPPPGGDMIVDDPIFNIGCTDARSICVTGAYAFFANPLGVFRTNGTSFPEDMTRLTGLSLYWQNLLASYSSTWTLSGGIYKNYYVITVMDGTTFKDAFFFDFGSNVYTAFRASNLKAVCFDNAVTIGEELYFGSRSAARVNKVSTMFMPSATYKNDGDGTAVAPVVETPMYGGGAGEKTWRAAYVEFDVRDSASDNPTLQVSYIQNPEDSYTDISSGNGGVLSESTNKTRKRIMLKFPSDSIGLKIAQTNASSDTRIYSIEADVHGREGSRIV